MIPVAILFVSLAGDAVAGRPLWTVEDPPALEVPDIDTPPPVTAAVVEVAPEVEATEPAPAPSPVPAVGRPVFDRVDGAGPTWPPPRGTPGRPADSRYELGTWSGLQRGRSGLDGGLQAELLGHAIRPALQLAPYRVGLGLGWRPAIYGAPLPFVVGLDYVHDFEDKVGRVGAYVSLARWR